MTYKFYDLEALAKCTSNDEIETELNNLDISSDVEQRTILLHQFMGTTQLFSCSGDSEGFTLEQEYGLAKRQLLMMNQMRSARIQDLK